jgi:hypothetical protein
VVCLILYDSQRIGLVDSPVCAELTLRHQPVATATVASHCQPLPAFMETRSMCGSASGIRSLRRLCCGLPRHLWGHPCSGNRYLPLKRFAKRQVMGFWLSTRLHRDTHADTCNTSSWAFTGACTGALRQLKNLRIDRQSSQCLEPTPKPFEIQ